MAVSDDSARGVSSLGPWSPGEEKSPEAGALAAGDGASAAGCNGCCASAGPEDLEGSGGGEGAAAASSSSPPLWKCCKVCWALGAGWLALLLALRLAKGAGEAETAQAAEDGKGAPPGGRWCPLLPGCGCCLLAAYFWLGLDLLRAGLRLRTAALLLAACCGGEALAQLAAGPGHDRLLSAAAGGLVLACLAGGTRLALGRRLLPRRGGLLLALTGALRLSALVSWESLRPSWTPHLPYLLALGGILLAGYARHAWPGGRLRRRAAAAEQEEEEEEAGEGAEGAGLAAAPPPPPLLSPPAQDEVPVLKRRRRSSSMIAAEMAGCGSKSHRRTSLPCIPREQVRHSGRERTPAGRDVAAKPGAPLRERGVRTREGNFAGEVRSKLSPPHLCSPCGEGGRGGGDGPDNRFVLSGADGATLIGALPDLFYFFFLASPPFIYVGDGKQYLLLYQLAA